jgi:O-antigen biosynthesis protein WbqV
MGATKRLMELYLQALDRASLPGGPRRLTARLGNVLGSAGSVAPLFERQISAGGPLTVTDPEVARFFITIEQSADFLLQATAVGLDMHHMRGVVHILEMGEPLRVVDLARDMIRLYGLEPDRDVPISFVGLRPGEKLREELTADDEWVEATISAGVKAVDSPPVSLPDMCRRLDRVVAAARSGSDDAVRAIIHDMVATKESERVRAAG